MDRLWTPWRYNYVTGGKPPGRKGVPPELEAWPGPDLDCVFCNLVASVRWGIAEPSIGEEAAERAGLVVVRLERCFVCLNAFPYSSGHLLVLPYRHVASLERLTEAETADLMLTARRFESVLQAVYRADGINLGMNLGKAAGAGVAEHLHLHMVPRWLGDTNFMTVTAETRILPEALAVTWERIRDSFRNR